jgi:hypothetical protein
VIRFADCIPIELSNIDLHHDQHGTPRSVSCFLPSARGVVELIAHDGSTILLAAAGNIRSFVAQRFGEDPEHGAKANLAPITAKIIAYSTGSGFESDFIVHERSRRTLAEQYTKINEQNRRAILVLDPSSGTWRVADTLSLDLGADECIVGPVLTSKAARSLGEALDDVFELCRYPKELASAPNGCPCAYKEMGRCPGACDGSEPMDTYRRRFRCAIEAASNGLAKWSEQLNAEIAQASAAMEFERAQRSKRALDTVGRLPIDALGRCGAMEHFACVCITPSVRRGWAMVWVFGRDGLIPVVSLNDDSAGIEQLIDCWHIQQRSEPIDFDRVWLDRLALLTRHWFTKPSRARRRRVTILDLRHSCWRRKLTQAISQASEPVELGHDDEEQTHIRG